MIKSFQRIQGLWRGVIHAVWKILKYFDDETFEEDVFVRYLIFSPLPSDTLKQ